MAHDMGGMAGFGDINIEAHEPVLTGVASLLVEKELISRQELMSQVEGRYPLAQVAATMVADNKAETTQARFAIGDKVRVRDIHPDGHTRVPRYVRGHLGEVIHLAPRFSFPDASAHGLPFRKESTYHVLFNAADLWTDSADNNEGVVVDLWETYLESAP